MASEEDMSEHATDRFWSGIEVSKVIAGTLAAVTAAVVGSFLGVAGTLAGAAVASVVGSLGTEIYHRSLNRGAKRIGAIAPTFVKVPSAVGTPPVAAATKQENPSRTVPPRRNIRWRHVAVASAALFVLAIGALTMFELMTGRSMASTVGTTSSSTTSVGSLFGGGSGKSAVTPTPENSEAPAVDETPTGPAERGTGHRTGTGGDDGADRGAHHRAHRRGPAADPAGRHPGAAADEPGRAGAGRDRSGGVTRSERRSAPP
nr:hypothetical protein GCM10020092_024350 [Actinoplanes digitatis]